MPSYPVSAKVARDNTEGFARVTGVHETNTERILNLIIEPNGTNFRLKVQSNDPVYFPATAALLDVDIPLSGAELWAAVSRCREVWRNEAVERLVNGRKLLQNEWDLGAHAALLEELLPELALAGLDLFEAIFFPNEALADPADSKHLRAVGEQIRANADTGRPAWIRISSNEFYAPWNFLYPRTLDRADGHDARPDGFWGYQNLIEHVPMPPRGQNPPNRGQDFVVSHPLRIALQLDESIDQRLNVACLQAVRSELGAYPNAELALVERNQSRELGVAFTKGALDEHVLYFCCHAQGDGDGAALAMNDAYFALTDNAKRITPTLIQRWLGQQVFKNGPIVFLNACQSGQMNSIFHRGFVPSFLSRRASAFVGTQTEVPAVFAGEFARRFFERFFAGNASLGQVLWELRREFVDKHNNPLGLLYSVYRGADVTLPVGLTRKG